MDPLGAAASFITVLGTLIASTDKAYSVISGLRDAPKEVKNLGQEVLALKAVISNVKAASELEIQFQQAPSSSQLQGPLADHIKLAQNTISAIEDMAKKLEKSSPIQSPSVRRTRWLKKRNKIERLRNDLNSQKINISLLLMTKTMTDIHSMGTGLHNMGTELHIMGHRLAQNELATSSRQDEHVLLLQRILQGQTHMTCSLHHDQLPPTRPPPANAGNVQLISSTAGEVHSQALISTPASGPTSVETQSSVFSEGSEVVPLNRSAVRALRGNERKLRLSVCPCSCHSTMQYSTSTITSKVFGSLIIGVAGRIFSNSVCDSPNCRDHSHFSITVAYYFPCWLVAKAIIIQCVRLPHGNPSFGLRVRNLLPEHSPVMRAIERGQPMVLRSMLEDRISSPDDMEEMAWTLLTFAIHKNQIECCNLLLDAGADPRLQDGFGNSAVDFAWLAVFENQLTLDTVEFLRQRLLPYEKEGVEEYNLSIVHRRVLGLETGNLEEQLEGTPQPIVNATDSFGKTPLLYASRRGDLEAVKSLIDNGADVNLSDSMRRSPLHMAARSRSIPIIKSLIKSGADPNAANFLNELPAHYACYEENSARLVKPLVDAKSDINLPSKYGRTMLDIAVQSGSPALAKYLIDSGAKTEGSNPTNWELEPLGRGILYKNHGAIRALLEKRVKTDFVDVNQESILHFLARRGDREVIQDFYCCEHLPVDAKCANATNKNAERPDDIARTRIRTFYRLSTNSYVSFKKCLTHRLAKPKKNFNEGEVQDEITQQ